MKLRYYLRGLGTGILITALILGRLIGSGRPLTDAEIRAKALTLGMVDANSVSLSSVGGSGDGLQNSSGAGFESDNSGAGKDVNQVVDPSTSPEGVESTEPDAGTDSGDDEGSGISPDVTVSPEVTDSPEPGGSSTPPSQAPGTPAPGSSETVTFVISSGESSYTVSARLADAGLVEDAREFDDYLVDNGYSRTIRAGTYQIPIGASWEEIAEIIS